MGMSGEAIAGVFSGDDVGSEAEALGVTAWVTLVSERYTRLLLATPSAGGWLLNCQLPSASCHL